MFENNKYLARVSKKIKKMFDHIILVHFRRCECVINLHCTDKNINVLDVYDCTCIIIFRVMCYDVENLLV